MAYGKQKSVRAYPVFLDLCQAPVVIVGGGAVAARKARGLAQAGARVRVVALDFSAALMRMKKIRRVRRAFRASDLAGARLVFAATGDTILNTRIAELARARGVFVNVAAPPEQGDLRLPATMQRGPLCVAFSTGGASPAAAKALRRELERHVDAAWGGYVALLETRRARVKAAVVDPRLRRRLLQALGDAAWVKVIRRQGRAAAAQKMDALIARAAEDKRVAQGPPAQGRRCALGPSAKKTSRGTQRR